MNLEKQQLERIGDGDGGLSELSNPSKRLMDLSDDQMIGYLHEILNEPGFLNLVEKVERLLSKQT